MPDKFTPKPPETPNPKGTSKSARLSPETEKPKGGHKTGSSMSARDPNAPPVKRVAFAPRDDETEFHTDDPPSEVGRSTEIPKHAVRRHVSFKKVDDYNTRFARLDGVINRISTGKSEDIIDWLKRDEAELKKDITVLQRKYGKVSDPEIITSANKFMRAVQDLSAAYNELSKTPDSHEARSEVVRIVNQIFSKSRLETPTLNSLNFNMVVAEAAKLALTNALTLVRDRQQRDAFTQFQMPRKRP